MADRSFLHVVRDARGTDVGMLRCAGSGSDARFEWLDVTGRVVLRAELSGPESTRILDAAGQAVPLSDRRPDEPGVRVLGSSAVMRTFEVAGHPAWIIDDYGNATRHFILGCTPDRFVHLNLDARGYVTLTEKTREHATLRTVRRDATGALLGDEAVVQPGEDLADVARRCGVTPEALRVAHEAPRAGAVVPIA